MLNEKTGDPVVDNAHRNFNRTIGRAVRHNLSGGEGPRKYRKENKQFESWVLTEVLVGMALDVATADDPAMSITTVEFSDWDGWGE